MPNSSYKKYLKEKRLNIKEYHNDVEQAISLLIEELDKREFFDDFDTKIKKSDIEDAISFVNSFLESKQALCKPSLVNLDRTIHVSLFIWIIKDIKSRGLDKALELIKSREPDNIYVNLEEYVLDVNNFKDENKKALRLYNIEKLLNI